MSFRFACGVFLLFAIGASVSLLAQQDTSPVSLPAADSGALKAAVHDLCHEQVALLGESPTHGDGHTEAFKVELVKQLVTRCHYSAVAFEASTYEFIAFTRAVQSGSATPEMLSDAVGGLWKYDREFKPLIPFLYERALTRKVRLAGLDYQIGGLGQSFTNEGMFTELSRNLTAERREVCRAEFHRYTMSDYPQDQPYGQREHDELLQCVREFRAGLPKVDPFESEEQMLLDNLQRLIEADLGTGRERYADREVAMYANFVRFADQLPASAKIIVWGASVHLAKNPGAVTRTAADESLGSRVKQRYGDKAFALGFAAAGGSYRVFKVKHAVEPAPQDSLEAQSLLRANVSSVYLNKRELNELGVVPSYALEHKLTRANWAGVFDGVVAFREEWPSHSTRPGYEGLQ